MTHIEFPILSIDVGKKRVGIALLESEHASTSLKRIFNRETKIAEREILKLILQKNIKTVVAGLPLDANNLKTAQCLDVEQFCLRIKKRSNSKFHFVDEYLSSEEAKQQFSKDVRVDHHAAEIILRRFLSDNSFKASIA
jgi:putative Holliday junction resolvase